MRVEDGSVVYLDGLPPLTTEELEASMTRAEELWAEEQQAIQRRTQAKTWPSVTEFWSEFTMQEEAGVVLSQDPVVQVLRNRLQMWKYEVRADDERITTGMQTLVDKGLLTDERRNQILGTT